MTNETMRAVAAGPRVAAARLPCVVCYDHLIAGLSRLPYLRVLLNILCRFQDRIDDKEVQKCGFKKRSTSSTCASLLETELSEENVKVTHSPLGNLKKKYLLTPRQSERNLDLSDPLSTVRKTKKSARLRLHGIVDWCRQEYTRKKSNDTYASCESPAECYFLRQPSTHLTHQRGVSRPSKGVTCTLRKAKRQIEDKLIQIGLVKGSNKQSLEDVQNSYLSRRNSFEAGEIPRDSEFVLLKERMLIKKKTLLRGIQRFSFLLETCQPGAVLEPHLMAALLDLPYAPVVARAAVLLECAHFVHQCNKGQWPVWMRLNFPMFRSSVSVNNRSYPTGLRRTYVLQRAAGKLFYQWAEAIGSRLEEFNTEDKKNYYQIETIMLEDSKRRGLVVEDEEEDFLDESSIITYGSRCPMALRLVACMLLLEITTFLRETYQTLPRSSRLPTKERPAPWDKYSREANRRWSMALSSMGHSQISTQSLQSIAGDRETGDVSSKSITCSITSEFVGRLIIRPGTVREVYFKCKPWKTPSRSMGSHKGLLLSGCFNGILTEKKTIRCLKDFVKLATIQLRQSFTSKRHDWSSLQGWEPQ
ncbi:protein unc-80 homolog [Copidosoma floridanum]|uniref:protein unc-80 homolog n=1 Tax=Copidosoma floridanum TaxID=29053 RepID=UPI0006C9DD67|nr:protein unc-80 homolog [Copidosoma floridanum]